MNLQFGWQVLNTWQPNKPQAMNVKQTQTHATPSIFQIGVAHKDNQIHEDKRHCDQEPTKTI